MLFSREGEIADLIREKSRNGVGFSSVHNRAYFSVQVITICADVKSKCAV